MNLKFDSQSNSNELMNQSKDSTRNENYKIELDRIKEKFRVAKAQISNENLGICYVKLPHLKGHQDFKHSHMEEGFLDIDKKDHAQQEWMSYQARFENNS